MKAIRSFVLFVVLITVFSPVLAAEDTSLVFIARKAATINQRAALKLSVDDKEIGVLLPGTYYQVSLPAGKHLLTVSSGWKTTSTSVMVVTPKNYYFSTDVKIENGSKQPEISLVIFEEMGKLMISQSKPAQ